MDDTGRKKLTLDIDLNIKQTAALDALESQNITEVLYGGAKGGGKSWFLADYLAIYAQRIIKLCNIRKGMFRYPPVIGFVGRQRAVDFNKTTLVTLKKALPSNIYEIKEQQKEIRFFNLVAFHFGGMDDQDTIQKFNSAEYGFIGVDQAEELERRELSMLRATQGRSKINKTMLPSKMLLTANPDECPLEQDFFGTTKLPHRKFIQALPSDNDALTPEERQVYIANLEESYKYFPELADAYIRGIWGAAKGGRYILDRKTCEILQKLVLPDMPMGRTVVSVDPAWLGEAGDEYVIYTIRGNKCIDKHYGYGQDTKRIANEALKRAKKFMAGGVIIDIIGVGGGVYDEVKATSEYDSPEHGLIGFNSAQKSENEESIHKYLNKRAEMYLTASEAMKANKYLLPSDDPELIDQLCNIKYEIKNGMMKIEPKADIKRRIGRSPDRADAWVQAVWALERGLVRQSRKYANQYRPQVNPQGAYSY